MIILLTNLFLDVTLTNTLSTCVRSAIKLLMKPLDYRMGFSNGYVASKRPCQALIRDFYTTGSEERGGGQGAGGWGGEGGGGRIAQWAANSKSQ